MQLRLTGAFGDAQGAGRLRVTKAIDAYQYEHVACALRKACNRALEIERRPFSPWIGHVGQTRSRLSDFVLDTQAAASGEHRVDGDAVQPGRKSAALFEVPQGPPSSDEGFLRTVLGGLALSREAQAQAVNSRRKLTVQVLEGDQVAAGGGGDEVDRLSRGIHSSRNLQHLNRPHCVPLFSFVQPIRDDREQEGLKHRHGMRTRAVPREK